MCIHFLIQSWFKKTIWPECQVFPCSIIQTIQWSEITIFVPDTLIYDIKSFLMRRLFSNLIGLKAQIQLFDWLYHDKTLWTMVIQSPSLDPPWQRKDLTKIKKYFIPVPPAPFTMALSQAKYLKLKYYIFMARPFIK